MPSWIAALKTYNSRQPAWCIPRKGTDEYNKVRKIMNGEKTKKPKILKQVDSFKKQDDIYEEPRNIQRTPTAVINTKRATINDVPQDVMNNIMGKYLGVADKAKLAAVGVKVKMTDEEKEEADRKSYNYNVYMKLIDRYKNYYKNYKKFNDTFKKIPKPDEEAKSYYMWNYAKRWNDGYLNGLENIQRDFRMGVKKKKGEKNKHLEIDYDKDELTFYDTKDNTTYTTNQEIYNLMKLPILSGKLQREKISNIKSSFSYVEGYEKNGLDFLLKNIKKPLYTKEKIEKIMRFAVIYSSVYLLKENSNLKLNYDVEYINKNLLLDKNPLWRNFLENTYGREKVVLKDKLLVYSGKYRVWESDYYVSWSKISWNTNIIKIFNMNHSKDPFNESVINKMEEDVKKIRNNYKDGTDGEYFSGHDSDSIKKYKKYIDDNKTAYEVRKVE